MVTTVVCVLCNGKKKKKKAGYRSVVVSSRCAAAPIAESPQNIETQPQLILFPRHTIYGSHRKFEVINSW